MKKKLMSQNFSYFYILCVVFIYLLGTLNLHCCPQAFCSYSEWGLLFVMGNSLLIVVASLTEHRL